MSRRVPLVANGNQALKSFASAVLAKASNNTVALVDGAAEASAVAIAVGTENPANVHSVITRPSEQKPALYSAVNTVFVRAVLPAPADNIAIRDLVDVYPAAGIKCDAEIAATAASFAKTAATAVTLAKANGNKLTVLVKQVSKHEQLNALFETAINNASAGSGVAVEFVGSAQVANTLIMAPETLSVVATADTPAGEVAEQLFSGIVGGVNRTFVGENTRIAAGNSANSVAFACADALRGLGLTAEAKKIEAAVSKSKGNDNGASILAAI